ncbi:MAG TPA: Ig-like domain-containing protein [Candidatus Udaeobacter sp.]|nr:Ig-like domain-containing protein [Candidatus Udaeobacter sp.]
MQYAATALFSNGATQDVSSTATWSSASTSVAQINSTGLATGIGLGTTNISATFKNVSSATEPLAVDQLNSIAVSPNSATQPPGSSQQFFAVGNFTFAAGGTSDRDVSSQVTWNSSNTGVATIDDTGNATTVGLGSTTITATSCDGITVGSATLLVSSPATDSLVVAPATITISSGTTTLFTVMEKLANGTIQALPPGTVVAWSSDTTTVATVDPNSGVALGVAAGTANITASSAGLNPGTAVLRVQAATARFAYVADAQGQVGTSFPGTISGYSVDVTSATPLTPLLNTPVVPASTPQQVFLHPSGDLMYYLDSAGFLHIDDITAADGSFADSKQNPVQASTSNQSTNVGVIDPTGRFIYVISSVDNSIYGFKITQTADKAPLTNGALSDVSPTFNPYTDATLNNPTWIMTDRAGKYVYVVNNGNDTISEYSIGADGTLSPLPIPNQTIATGSFPEFGTTDVNGHLYVANEGPPQSVSGYSIDSGTGQLTSVGAGTPVTGATFTINVITDPTGKYLYVLDSTTGPPPPDAPLSQVFAFNLDSTSGVIGSQIGTPLLAGNSPNGMAIDPTGVLLAIDNNFDNTLSLFTIAPSGSTTPPPGGITATTPPTVATDNQPLFVVFYTAASGQ